MLSTTCALAAAHSYLGPGHVAVVASKVPRWDARSPGVGSVQSSTGSSTRTSAATVARSWAAQQRLCGKFRTLAARKDSKSVVNAAVARELAGFVWAEMVAED